MNRFDWWNNSDRCNWWNDSDRGIGGMTVTGKLVE